MTKTAHRIYIGVLVLLVAATFISLMIMGGSYYRTPLEERFYHPDHALLKPSGTIGHGLGIIGTLCILIGVSSYMTRKRWRALRSVGILKHWLEFHIFLCAIGPVMVLFHTAFKFGGIVSVSFWSMVGVVISGIIGRFIYIQIPRTIHGRELSLQEVRGMKVNIGNVLKQTYNLPDDKVVTILDSVEQEASDVKGSFFSRQIRKWIHDKRTLHRLKTVILSTGMTRIEVKTLLRLVKNEMTLNQKIDRLQTMQKLFRYWHVAHLPFALIMLIIMVVHVAVTLAFGYKWIF